MNRLLAWIFLIVSSTAGASTPLNSSIIMFHDGDFATCPNQISEVVKLGNKRVLLGPTLFFLADHQQEVTGFCLGRQTGGCEPLNSALIAEYQSQWVQCVNAAVNAGVDVTIVPHLDDGNRSGIWRNTLLFDPLKSYAGYSYNEIMIVPFLSAIDKALTQGRTVEFSLVGEMGATVFHFPESYLSIFRGLRRLFPSPHFRLGVSLNFNKISGSYSGFVLKALAVQNLLNESDFLGISAYSAVSVNVMPHDFLSSINIMTAEFASMGISIPSHLIFNFSEVGVGGGTKLNDGKTPATSPAEAAMAPYSGIYHYTPLNNPWATARMSDFRFRFHKALLEFLSAQRAGGKMGNAFLWNANSWDPQGLYGEARFKDDEITSMIQNYNAMVEK